LVRTTLQPSGRTGSRYSMSVLSSNLRRGARFYLRVGTLVLAGSCAISILAGTFLVLIPIATSGGNGTQLAGIAATAVLLIATVAGTAVGLGAGIVGSALAFGSSRILKSSNLELPMFAIGAAIGSIPASVGIASFMGWPLILSVACVAVVSAIGATLSWLRTAWIHARRVHRKGEIA
jgi:hypothetical protein